MERMDGSKKARSFILGSRVLSFTRIQKVVQAYGFYLCKYDTYGVCWCMVSILDTLRKDDDDAAQRTTNTSDDKVPVCGSTRVCAALLLVRQNRLINILRVHRTSFQKTETV
jgi:hypothetical protein